MRERIHSFLVVLLLMFGSAVFSQEKRPVSIPISLKDAPIALNDSSKVGAIRPDFYTKNLTFFCRQELRIEKATSVPLRVRLGSLDHVNYLERKPGYTSGMRQ